MKNRISPVLVLFAVSFVLSPASGVFGQAGATGAGFIVGEPTGISVKHFLTHETAVDIGAAWSFTKDSHFHLHADYLFHNYRVLKDEFEVTSGELPLYYGIGGRIRFDKDTRVGIRLVGGVSYHFAESPVDVFFEIAPIMDLAPKTELNGNVDFGVRFWFP
jgi:hypothetical protein